MKCSKAGRVTGYGYIAHLYWLAVQAGFYSIVVECSIVTGSLSHYLYQRTHVFARSVATGHSDPLHDSSMGHCAISGTEPSSVTVQVGNDQEMAQSERNSYSTNRRVGKN